MTGSASELKVMTSGAFTAAHLALMPKLASAIGARVVTASTSIGTGENSIPNRLKRGEVVDIVIVSDTPLQKFVQDVSVLADGVTVLARSIIAIVVRAGAAKPDIRSADALNSRMLRAKWIGYSASVSGPYVTTELVQRLGIAEQVLPKCHFVGDGERVGAVVARGELEIGFQQLSELLPVKGIDHIPPLPPDLQKVSPFAAGVAATSPDQARARSAIEFLASEEAVQAIKDSGLEPVAAHP